jgi:SAM-dependent methyltransferase
MSIPTFAARRKAWSSPPVDDIGYLPAEDLLAMDDDAFDAVIQQAVVNRYSGWRNWREHWTNLLTRWDVTQGKRILDYGCGIGLEGLILAKRNEVVVADISPDNLLVAQRAFELNGHEPPEMCVISDKPPFIIPTTYDFDIILCLGVLHHIPDPVPVVGAMHGWLKPGGELRLMVYSDYAWRNVVGTEPPDGNVEDDPGFEQYWKHWDAVGGYADWYNRQRLFDRFGGWFSVADYRPLTPKREYVGAVLVKI